MNPIEYNDQGNFPTRDGSRLFLSVTEYALREGISRQTALWRLKKGKVKAERVGRQWVILLTNPKD